MSNRVAPLLLGPALAVTLAACGEEAPPTPAELPPLVGALEVPIAFRNDAPQPSGALRIEASMSELRLEGQPVYTDLSRGLVPDTEWTSEGLTQLLTRVRAAPARSAATITLLGTVPYETAVRVVQTLSTAGYHEIVWAVRPPGGSPTARGWLAMSNPLIAPSTGTFNFPGGARRWDEFTAHWAEMYDACRAGQYIDCDGSPNEPIQGGDFQMVLWARGQGMQIRFNQLNAPDAGVAAPAQPALIEGVPADPSAGAEPPPPPPDTSGVFSFRADEATHCDTDRATGTQTPNSAISTTVRPVCGAAPCSVLIEADAETPIMRVLSFVGASFPNGSTAPIVAFRMPE
ncbi:MAG: hypothetical protein K1X94_14225 [Sandaracinaceae bacterium]|nr:hypothetical protein [Sandaracinaceae bacterium]